MDYRQEQVLCYVVLALAATGTLATATNNTTSTPSTLTTTTTTTVAPRTTQTTVPPPSPPTTAAAASSASARNDVIVGTPSRDSDTSETTVRWNRQGTGGTGQAQPQQVDDDDSEPYSFDYSVRDPTTGDSKSQWESRVNGIVRGAYSLLQPDGSLRSVSYTADNLNGFRALVKVDTLGLPRGPGGRVPTSSVSSSAANAAATHPPLYQFPPIPGSDVGASSTPVSTPPGQVDAPTGSAAAASSPFTSSSSTIEPSALLSDGIVAQALRGSPPTDDGEAWRAILGPSSTSTASGTAVGEGGNDVDVEQFAQLFGEGQSAAFSPQDAGDEQPTWLHHGQHGGEQNSVDDSLGGVVPPVQLPLEHEVTGGTQGGHFEFADLGDDGQGGQDGRLEGSQGHEQALRLLMRRQRARKRHVHGPVMMHHLVNKNNIRNDLLVKSPVTYVRMRHNHHEQPPRWLWVMKKE